jgi:hypothetical protein
MNDEKADKEEELFESCLSSGGILMTKLELLANPGERRKREVKSVL